MDGLESLLNLMASVIDVVRAAAELLCAVLLSAHKSENR